MDILEKNNPSSLVSVIIPTYKRANRINFAINSVLQQSYANIEVIVVDDNEPNSIWRKETEIALGNYCSDSRVIYLKHECNKNGAAARNTGIKASRGNIICFLDDDDTYFPSKIEKQVKFLLMHKEYQAVYTGTINKAKKEVPTLTGSLIDEILLLKAQMYTPTLAFRREALLKLKGFDESFRRHQDYELLIRFFREGFQIGLIPEPLVELGENEGENIPNAKKIESIKKEFFYQFYNEINSSLHRKKIYSTHFFVLSISFLKEFHILKGCEYLFKSFVFSPSVFFALISKKMKILYERFKEKK
ncbi:glycosyltransferase family 2 protein [Porphyromonas macacae]|uniref:glycosyltransferase family 2 protein n=1 Tax=Porphyromonas macacae TaxID=28115 RepID=UPI00068D1574|nr:glycosyltransferase family A protein [Porphyromonas macacae]